MLETPLPLLYPFEVRNFLQQHYSNFIPYLYLLLPLTLSKEQVDNWQRM